MKTSIIFITLLFAVSCKIQSAEEAAFVQLTKDPRAEAILATVAIQMQQNNGFLKVQALLNQLVTSARQNLLANNRLYRKAEARCDVYNHKLQEKDEYFETLIDSLNGEKVTLVEAEQQAGEALKSRISAVASYKRFQSEEVKRFSKEQLFYADIRNTVSNAQNSIRELLTSLKSKQGLSSKFIQTNVQEVSEAYAKVFNLNVDIPASFVQLSIDNNAARQRIINWLEDINITFASMLTTIKEDESARKSNSDNFVQLLVSNVSNLEASSVNITGLRQKYSVSVQEYASNVKTFSDFRRRNQENLVENTKYCNNETANYGRVKKGLESDAKIYEELLVYFNENFRKVSRMINEKYATLK